MKNNKEITITAINIVEDGKFKRIPADTTILSKDLEVYRELCQFHFENDEIFFEYNEKK